MYRDAISHSRKLMSSKQNDVSESEDFFESSSYRQACGLFKLFLAESTELGKRVWTQFDERGMAVGIGILFAAWIACAPLWMGSIRGVIVGMMFSRNRSAYGVHLDGNMQVNGGMKENV